MRAARFLNLQDAQTHNADAVTLFRVFCDSDDEIAENGFTCSFRQLMLVGQGRCKMLERHRTTSLPAAAVDFAVLSELAIISCPH